MEEENILRYYHPGSSCKLQMEHCSFLQDELCDLQSLSLDNSVMVQMNLDKD